MRVFRLIPFILVICCSYGVVVNVGSSYSEELFSGIVFQSFLDQHYEAVQSTFDEALYIAVSMEYRLLGLSNKSTTLDLVTSIAWSHEKSLVYIDVSKHDWTPLKVVHRIPVSEKLLGINNLTKFHFNVGLHNLEGTFEPSLTSMELRHISWEFIPQPKKNLPFENRNRNVCKNADCQINSEDPCRLLGSANAVLLNYVAVEPQVNESSLRLFCGIFSMERNHNTHIRALMDTWASRCTFFLVFSTVDDPTIPSVSVPHIGEESYRNMWQKIRSIWRYIHRHYSKEYDYFFLGGDDVYVLMDNLYGYLESDEVRSLRALNRGVYLGHTFVNPQTKVAFNSGGSGYLLDSIALESLSMNLDEPHCNPTLYTSEEDTFVATCLVKSLNSIVPFNTSDEHGRERFHHFTPSFYLTYQPRYDPLTGEGMDWYSRLDPHIRVGLECCSERSISFHGVYESLMYSMHDYLFKCPVEDKRRYFTEHGENAFYRVDKDRF